MFKAVVTKCCDCYSINILSTLKKKKQIMSVRALSEELQNKALSDLNEVPSRLYSDIDNIIQWIRQQPHLTTRTDAQWIVTFLRGCKFSLQKTKDKLDSYYTLRSLSPEIFQYRDPFLPEVREVFKRSIFIVLPAESNQLAPRRTLTRLKNADVNVISITDILKVITMLTDILLYEDDAYVVNGQELIIDLEDIPYGYVAQLGPRLIKTVVIFLQSSYPLNIKGIHFLNTPSFFHAILNMLVSMLSEKIKSRVRFYARHEIGNLYKSIPKTIFPEEYGGEAGTISGLSNEGLAKLEKHNKWFLEDARYCTDETKRPGVSKLSSELYGAEGSFRQLEID